MKRTTIKGLLAAAALATVAITATACEVPEDGTNHAEEVVKEHDAKDKKSDEKDKPAEEKAPEPEYTASQEQAIASALDYLDFNAFSKSGLVEQLEFEQFSPKDAQFAVDHIDVDWNTQAAASAESYLDMSSFSKSGLIDQLVFEGYTVEQATYGVNKTGL